MTVSTPVRTVEDIVGGLGPHVWTLVRAQKLDAALVLLAAEAEAFLRAQAEPLEGRIVEKVPSRELVVYQHKVPAVL